MKNRALISALFVLFFVSSTTSADTIVWQGGSGNRFATAANWVGGVAPVSGIDTVQFGNSTASAFLGMDFTVGNGQSFEVTQNYVFRIANNGHLTVATGGTVDFTTGGNGIFAEQPSGTAMNLTIESGATLSAFRYFDEVNYTTNFIADASGVSTFNVTNLLALRGATLNVDLSNYDASNGDLVLFDYDGSLSGTYGTVNIIGGTGTIDYAYDIGGGDLGIAITNATSVPEPAGLLMLTMLGLTCLARRRVQ